jgi:hypothetical protein
LWWREGNFDLMNLGCLKPMVNEIFNRWMTGKTLYMVAEEKLGDSREAEVKVIKG